MKLFLVTAIFMLVAAFFVHQSRAFALKLCLMLDREFDKRVAAAQAEFCGDVVAVVFDGADADAQGSAGALVLGETGLPEAQTDPERH